MTELDQSLKFFPVPFGEGFDTSVGQIPYPTHDSESLGQIGDFPAEENPLNNS